ncbi:serine hydrolase domain-containing protein [soil metagenome]
MKHLKTDARRIVAALALTLAVLGAVVAAKAGASAVVARTLSPQKLAAIGDYLNGEIAAGKFPGAVVLVQQHGKPVYSGHFGSRDVGGIAPMSDDTIFRLYSMSKPITSVAAMMLVEDGKLRLDDPVSKYIPAFADAEVGVDRIRDNGIATLALEKLQRPITIEDLLRHTSGITYGFYGDDPARKRYSRIDLFYRDFDNADFADRIAHTPLAEQPGTLWDYGHSTDVLGRVIEVVSGQSLLAFEQQRLLWPLGMTDTSFYVSDETKRTLIAEPRADDRMIGPVVGMRDPMDVRRWQSGGGGMVSSITDYARFLQMLLNGGTFEGHQYLKPETIALMTTDHIGPGSGVKRDYFYFPGAGSGFGLGFAVRTRELASEPGPVGEYRWDGVGGTFFWIDPRDDMFVLLMAQPPSQRVALEGEVRKLVYEAWE